jgi:hypothetical protein
MAYFIKWLGRDGTKQAPPMQFASIDEALDWACAVLPERPTDLWIEESNGLRVSEMTRIILHCRGSARPAKGATGGRRRKFIEPSRNTAKRGPKHG